VEPLIIGNLPVSKKRDNIASIISEHFRASIIASSPAILSISGGYGKEKGRKKGREG
jgi:hypothetical protein